MTLTTFCKDAGVIAPASSCIAYFGDYNQLLYLRARHYSPYANTIEELINASGEQEADFARTRQTNRENRAATLNILKETTRQNKQRQELHPIQTVGGCFDR